VLTLLSSDSISKSLMTWFFLLVYALYYMNLKLSKKPITSNEVTEEYLDLIRPLQYLTNKEQFLDPTKPIRIANGILHLLPFIEQDQCSYWISDRNNFAHITMPNNRVKIIKTCDYGINHNPVLYKVFNDKYHTTQILKHHNIACTTDFLLLSPSEFVSVDELIDQAIEFANTISYPLIVKPIDSLEWKWVQEFFNQEQLQSWLRNNYYHPENYSTQQFIVQNFLKGSDYRIIYHRWEVRIAYERIAPFIIGDGVSTIHQLIEPTTAYRVSDAHVIEHLTLLWHSTEEVPWAWEKIQILPTANVSTGASTKIITHEITQKDIDFLNHIAECFGAVYFGIDIISTGSISDWVVLEINNQPGVSGVSGAPKTMWINYQIGKKTRNAIKKSEWIID